MAKVIELSYKGYPIYKGNIVEGEFYYKSPEGSIPQEEWNGAICDLISRFDKFLKNGGNHPVPPPVAKVAYAHATF